MPTGAEQFVSTLETLGIRRIFTLVGDHLNEVLPAAARAGFEIVHMRHESGVTHAADACARLSRGPAVSLVTGGPGHTNSLTGIATAYLAGSPLIAVSGSRASNLADRQAFQDIDQIGMASSVVKWAAQPPDASRIPFYLARAFREANSGRKGPAHLTIPLDLFAADVDSSEALVLPAPLEASPPAAADIDRALALLRSAERPVVIAGSGIWWSDAADELREFIDRTSLPLYTITMARGVVPDSHPLCFGYADPALNRASRKAFQQADLFLILGKRIDYRLGLGGPRVLSATAQCVQVDIHPQELGMNRALDLAICADLKKTLRAMLDALGSAKWPARPWIEQLRAFRSEWRDELRAVASDRSEPIHPAAFFAELQKALPSETLYSWDGGDFIHWGRAMTPALHAGGWLRLGPLGTIGSALPNAVALKLLNPDRPVVMITGDGALGFYIAEMETLVRHKLPVVIVVGNDAGWGLERELQSAANPDEPTVACELGPVRYDIIMQGFGGGGETVDSLEQVVPAVRRAFESGVPYCLNVKIRGVRSPFTEWQIAGKRRGAPAPVAE
jgi:acetolactate synthase-1/2/3 large subunit